LGWAGPEEYTEVTVSSEFSYAHMEHAFTVSLPKLAKKFKAWEEVKSGFKKAQAKYEALVYLKSQGLDPFQEDWLEAWKESK
jgi:hypothetical protein